MQTRKELRATFVRAVASITKIDVEREIYRTKYQPDRYTLLPGGTASVISGSV